MRDQSILQIGKLIITANGFSWKNQDFSYNEIAHITFYREIMRNSVNFVKNATEHALLDISLANQNKIHIATGDHGLQYIIGGNYFSDQPSKKSHSDSVALSHACKILSENTFKHRLVHYANQLTKSGYFIYDNKYFFHDGRVLSGNKGEFLFTDNPQFSAFELVLSKPPATALQKITSALSGYGSALKISTRTDNDVFHYLFDVLLNQVSAGKSDKNKFTTNKESQSRNTHSDKHENTKFQEHNNHKRLHTHYDNLKVARDAPPEVIRAAYRTLAQKYHPDYNPNPDAVRIMKIINESYAILSDPDKRKEHDLWIEERERTDRK
jgi:DnaJ domain